MRRWRKWLRTRRTRKAVGGEERRKVWPRTADRTCCRRCWRTLRRGEERERRVGAVCPAEEEGGEAQERKRPREGEVREEPEEGMGQEEGEEAREVKAPPIPDTPSREQVRLHRLTHRPYRSWCPHCVAARRPNTQHRSSSSDSQRADPLLVADYCLSCPKSEGATPGGRGSAFAERRRANGNENRIPVDK